MVASGVLSTLNCVDLVLLAIATHLCAHDEQDRRDGTLAKAVERCGDSQSERRVSAKEEVLERRNQANKQGQQGRHQWRVHA